MKDCLQPYMQESPEAGLGAARQRWVPDVALPSQQQHWRSWSCSSRVMDSARRQDNLVPSALWANREWKSLPAYGTGAVSEKEIMKASFFPCISFGSSYLSSAAVWDWQCGVSQKHHGQQEWEQFSSLGIFLFCFVLLVWAFFLYWISSRIKIEKMCGNEDTHQVL